MKRERHASEQQERYRRQLFEAEVGALVRLREASQLRDDLVASVSHEFRTPLTAIRGSAVTLLGRHDALRPEDRDRLLAGIVEHSDRLGRLLEDMLVAASAAAVDRGAVADVSEAVGQLGMGGPARPQVTVETAEHVAAYIDSVWLDQIVQAMRDHVRTEAHRDRPAAARAAVEGCEAAISVTYMPQHPIDDATQLFEAFASTERLRTGRPVSLALYVARRLAEVHGGRVAALRRPDGQVTLSVYLRAVQGAGRRPRKGQDPRDLPQDR